MKITTAGNVSISGAGVFPEHPDWMLLESVKFGKAASDTMAVKADPTEEKKTAKELLKEQQEKFYDSHADVERVFDLASPELMIWLKEGDPRTVEFDHCTPTGVSLFLLTLKQAKLTEYSLGSQSPEGIPETLKISWDGFEIRTTEIGPDGKPKPS